MTNAKGGDAWPITATTWVIMYKKPKRAPQSKTALGLQVGAGQRPVAGRVAGLRAAAQFAGQENQRFVGAEHRSSLP